jgi:hypothetical protein
MKNGLLPFVLGARRELENNAATTVGATLGFAYSTTGIRCAVQITGCVDGQAVGIDAVRIGLILEERMKNGLRPLAVH